MQKTAKLAIGAILTATTITMTASAAKLRTTTTTTLPKAVATQVRMLVTETALYKVTAADLAAATGITVADATANIKARTVRMSNMGSMVTWLPASDNAALYFVGEAIDNPYGPGNVYWIALGGTTGATMATLSTRAPRSKVAGLAGFAATKHCEEDLVSGASLFFDPEADFRLWGYASASSTASTRKSFAVALDGVSTASATAQIKVLLQGTVDKTPNPDKTARVYVNGTAVGEVAWDGATACTLTASFSQSLLVEGQNVVEVESVLPAGVTSSVIYIDSFDVTYVRRFAAVAERLVSNRGGYSTVTVSGFGSKDIKVLDLTNVRQPKVMSAVLVTTGSGYEVTYPAASSTANYLAATLAGAPRPAAITGVVPANLAGAANAGEYVVIAPSALAAAAEPLAAHRAAQGLAAKVVTLESIYDEFNAGIADPVAIQAFLVAAAGWSKAPRYVVLAGQGSVDFRNALGYGDCLVPPLMIATAYGLAVSDAAIADTDADGVPDVAIGRLPVKTAAELQGVIAKIVAYESGGTWKGRVLMVADNADAAGDYTLDAEAMAAIAGNGALVEKSYLAYSTTADVRAALQGGFNAGCQILNYIGHAVTSKLATEGLLTTTDVAALANAQTPPVVFAMSCDAGDFSAPGTDCIAEALVARAGGGAVAAWAASDYTFSAESRIFNAGAFDALYTQGAARLGDAIRSAHAKYAAEGHLAYMRHVYNLLGDPATKVSAY